MPCSSVSVTVESRVMRVMLATLHSHLERHHIEYLQFAFRWMNNLLMREMPLHCVIRLWDTYLVRICSILSNGFSLSLLVVCFISPTTVAIIGSDLCVSPGPSLIYIHTWTCNFILLTCAISYAVVENFTFVVKLSIAWNHFSLYVLFCKIFC